MKANKKNSYEKVEASIKLHLLCIQMLFILGLVIEGQTCPDCEEFKTSIQELYDYLNENEGPDDQFIEQVKRNVVDWLFQHIKTFDRSVAEYIHLKDNSNRL